MSTKDLPMSMGAESLELALRTITELTKMDKSIEDATSGYADAVVTLTIDGCTIGRVERLDDFYMFIPNSNWFGGNVEDMGLEERR